MKKRNSILLITLGLVFSLFTFAVLSFGRAFPSNIAITGSNKNSYFLTMDSELFYRQTLNNCGPYSVMAVLNILRNEKQDPEVLAKEIRWRIHKNLTYPQGVIDLLHTYNITTREYILKNKTNAEKLNWLREMVQNGSPVILLVKLQHTLHYVTVLGYTADGFMLYDSMQEKASENTRKTIIDDDCISGNRFYKNEEVLQLWNDGGYAVFFKNWALVCSVEKSYPMLADIFYSREKNSEYSIDLFTKEPIFLYH